MQTIWAKLNKTCILPPNGAIRVVARGAARCMKKKISLGVLMDQMVLDELAHNPARYIYSYLKTTVHSD